MCYRTQFSKSDEIEQNDDFGQNSKIFFVLTAVNIDKRFLRPLGVAGDVLCVFCATASAVSCAKQPKSRENHSKKGYKRTKFSNSRFSDYTHLGAPPAPAGLVLVQCAAEHGIVLRDDPLQAQAPHALQTVG